MTVSACSPVMTIERDGRSEAASMIGGIRIRYRVVLAVLGLLAIASFLTLSLHIRQQQDYGRLINLSGQQRMLSQRIEMLAERWMASRLPTDRGTLLHTVDRMADIHEVLTDARRSRLSPAVAELYFGPANRVDREVRSFLQQARQLAQTPETDLGTDHPSHAQLKRISAQGLLDHLDAVVQQYQREDIMMSADLYRVAGIELLVMLVALIFSAAGVFRPLVRRVQTEVACLNETEKRLRGILDGALDGIVTIDATGAIIEFNRSAETLFGFRFEAVRGQDIADLIIPPEARDAHRRGIRHLLEAGDNQFFGRRLEITALRADGSTFPAELTITATNINSRRLFTAFLRDLSERRQAEATLRTLSRAVEQSPVSIVITDPDGRIEYVNPKFVEVTGYAASEALGRTPALLKSEYQADAVYAELWRTITGGDEWRGELYNRRKDGSLFWEHVTISPIRASGGTISHFVAIKEDLTRHKEYEARLVRQSHYDPVTGLPNRLLAMDRLAHDMARLGQQGGAGRGPVHRPRPLQRRQRHVRPRDRRPGSGRGRPPDQGVRG